MAKNDRDQVVKPKGFKGEDTARGEKMVVESAVEGWSAVRVLCSWAWRLTWG